MKEDGGGDFSLEHDDGFWDGLDGLYEDLKDTLCDLVFYSDDPEYELAVELFLRSIVEIFEKHDWRVLKRYDW
jgi:hypothetical protein